MKFSRAGQGTESKLIAKFTLTGETAVNRIDISEFLVHFTKGDDAANNFQAILNGAKLLGGTGYIKGRHRCVCFTEAPLHALQAITLNPTQHK